MNRMIYDDCAFKTRVYQSMTPMQYVMDVSKFEHCNKCRPELGIVGGTAVSHINGNLVDLENNLMGIDRPASLCPANKHLPTAPGAPIRVGCHPPIDTTMRHMNKCQFSSYPSVPLPPAPTPFSCPK